MATLEKLQVRLTRLSDIKEILLECHHIYFI